MHQITAPSSLVRDGKDLDNLKASIKKHGQLQPIVVDAASGEVLIGERRRRAIVALHLEPEVVEIDTDDEAEALAIRLSDEMTKTDVPLVEKAEAFRRYAELSLGEHVTTRTVRTARLHTRLGISEQTADDLLQIAGLPAEVKRAAKSGEVGAGALRVIGRSDITEKQKTVLAKKAANGKIPNSSARGVEDVISYAKKSDPLVAKQILDDPNKSFEDAKRTAERVKDKDKRDKRDPGLPFVWFVHRMVSKLDSYATDLAGLHPIATQIPDNQRRKLIYSLEHLKKQIDRWLTTLEGQTALPPNGAKMKRVLEKVGGEWTEVEVGG